MYNNLRYAGAYRLRQEPSSELTTCVVAELMNLERARAEARAAVVN